MTSRLLWHHVLGMHGARQRWKHVAMTPARSRSFVNFVPSWWRIAEPRLVVAYPKGFSRTGKVSLVTPAILHHEGTKITKERGCGGADETLRAGIVAHTGFCLGDQVDPVLEAPIAAGKDRFRGIRQSAGRDRRYTAAPPAGGPRLSGRSGAAGELWPEPGTRALSPAIARTGRRRAHAGISAPPSRHGEPSPSPASTGTPRTASGSGTRRSWMPRSSPRTPPCPPRAGSASPRHAPRPAAPIRR